MIATRKGASTPNPNKVVGHIPKQHLILPSLLLVAHGAVVTVQIVSLKLRRSPRIRGGLEIPIEVYVVMAYSDEKKQALDTCKYPELVNDD